MSNTTTDPSKPDAPFTFNQRDPLAVRGIVLAVVGAVIGLGVALGAPISEDVKLAILSLVGTVTPLLVVVLARPKVTANAKVLARVTTSGLVLAGEAAQEPTETIVGSIDVEDDEDNLYPDVTVRPELLANPHGHDDGDLSDDGEPHPVAGTLEETDVSMVDEAEDVEPRVFEDGTCSLCGKSMGGLPFRYHQTCPE